MRKEKAVKTYFYQDVIDMSDVESYMEELQLQDEVQEELYDIVHHTLYIEVIKLALDEMPSDLHKEFLQLVEAKPHDKGLWILFKRTVENAEQKLEYLVDRLKQDFFDMLDDYKQASQEWLEADLRSHRKQ